MSRFDALDRLAARSVETVMGEPFLLEPQAGAPNGRRAPDTERAVVSGTAIYSERAADQQPVGRPRFSTLTTPGTPTISVGRHLFGFDAPQQGDMVRLLERDVAYDVTKVEADGSSRWRLSLARRGR